MERSAAVSHGLTSSPQRGEGTLPAGGRTSERGSSMKVLIIGGAGMIGRKLAERLAKDGTLAGKAISKLTLYDVLPGAVPAGAKMPVDIATGDLPAPGEAD